MWLRRRRGIVAYFIDYVITMREEAFRLTGQLTVEVFGC